MQIKKKYSNKETVVIFLHDKTSVRHVAAESSKDVADLLTAYRKANKVKDHSFEAIQLSQLPDSPKVVFANLGASKDITMTRFRHLAASIVRQLSSEKSVQWCSIESIDAWESHLAQVIEMVNYEVPTSKSDKKKPDKLVKHSIISANKLLVTEGSIVGQSINKARTFANQPANILTTAEFVKQIKSLFKGDKRYTVSVLTETELKKRNMNALLGVGQGSQYPSYLVDITYHGSKKSDHIAIVGKGVVFDTGGISLKPSRNMREMKGDMGGAAAVVAAAWATGQLNESRPVSFIVPIVENMVSSLAQRPGDVVVASNGKSIEITNTDAEGRLILADALVYAAKKKVDCILDVATLTGASVIALGPYAIAVMGNQQALIDQLVHHAKEYNEQCWQLPLFDEYKDLLKSDVADILNANEGREAGAITAAKFLEQFVDKTPWAHLDIASTMSVSSNKGDQVKGMTGSGTRSLISFIRNYKK